MTGLETAFFTLLGACFGSFIAAMAWRLPRGVTVWGRSACPACGHVLGVADLLPVLSFLLSRGGCRYCGGRVAALYPLLEAATALLWLGCALWFADPVDALLVAWLGTALLFLALVDAQFHYLPDIGVALAGLAGLLWLGWQDVLALWADHLAAAGLYGGLALALRLLVSRWKGREALGLGDVKLMAVAGLWLGLAGLPAFLILSGGIGILCLLTARHFGGAGQGDAIAFGPALCLALFMLVLAGY
jgi:leader peptidase (prepilin peptidase)/N-methyltransferase